MARNWFYPTIAVMHLHAYLAQALLPGSNNIAYAQLPGISESDIKGLAENVSSLEDFVRSLEDKGDARVRDVEKAVHRWGRLEVFDSTFKGKYCQALTCCFFDLFTIFQSLASALLHPPHLYILL